MCMKRELINKKPQGNHKYSLLNRDKGGFFAPLFHLKANALPAVICMLLMGMTLTGCVQKEEFIAENVQSEIVQETEKAAEGEIEEAARENVPIEEKPYDVLRAEYGEAYENYRTYYQVFVYSFYDSNGDGIGDLKGVTKKLDYISNMGFNGIWLSPIMKAETYHKYDVVDYNAIDSQYGTMEDFEELVRECKKRDIKLILDLVINHTSSANAWFQSAVESLQTEPCGLAVCSSTPACREHNPYCQYYNFADYKITGNYQKITDDWYYECGFASNMPDVRITNEAVRKDLEAIMKFWLDKGVGGFRLDAALHYGNSYADAVDTLKWVTDYVKSYNAKNYLVAEIWTDFNTYVNYYESGVDSIFNFSFADNAGKITKMLTDVSGNYTGKGYAGMLVKNEEKIQEINPEAIDAPFLANHDVGRAAGFMRKQSDKIKMAAAMNLFMTGNAFVYYGEELGMTGSGKDENLRAPMYWSADAAKEGMTVGPPGMEVQQQAFAPYEQQKEDAASIYWFYRQVLKIRNEVPEIAAGKTSVLEEIEDYDICAISKTLNDSTVSILYNLSEEEKSIELSAIGLSSAEIRYALCTREDTEVIREGNIIRLPAYAIVIISLES